MSGAKDDPKWVRPLFEGVTTVGERPQNFAPRADFTDEGGAEPILEVPVAALEVLEPEAKDKKNEVVTHSAKRFVEALDAGKTPGQAAKAAGMTLKQIKDGGDMSKAIQHLLEVGHVRAEVKKEVIRAGLFKAFVEGITSPDPGERKLALEASKQMASDPEIGLTRDSEVAININLGALDEALLGVDLPGIKNPFKETKGDG